MYRWVRWLVVVCGVCCVAGFGGLPAIAFGDGFVSDRGSVALSPLGDSLVISGSPVEGEQVQAQEKADRSNPVAVAEREASRTKFEGLDGEQAASVDREAFPRLIDEPVGEPPELPPGQRIIGYPTDDAAQVELPEGERGVIESAVPLAVETVQGQRVPLDLALNNVGNAFEPAVSAVGVRIPRSLSEGVQLSNSGASLTPVDRSGAALSDSEGSLEGATVAYPNAQTDADTIVKPVTLGFEIDTLLRSINSPRELFFRVGLPKGASLVQQDGSSAVQVLDAGQMIAVIPPPSAVDAEGTIVPLSMSVFGDTVVLTVDDTGGSYRYPIMVDPAIVEEGFETVGKQASWAFSTDNTVAFEHDYSSIGDQEKHLYKEGQYAYFVYTTQGESHIYDFAVEVEQKGSSPIQDYISIASPGEGVEGSERIYEVLQKIVVCPFKVCSGSIKEGNQNNRAYFEVLAGVRAKMRLKIPFLTRRSLFFKKNIRRHIWTLRTRRSKDILMRLMVVG
jgi:hypothetical protein